MVYLICFDIPFKHVRHYIGYTKGSETLDARMEAHRKGRGGRLMAAVSARGIGWRVVRTWPDGDQALERRLKRWKNARRQLCPECKARAKAS